MENLRQKLATAVKSIQWSYAIFWSISTTEPGVLTWCDGYYNGDIKTRKTVQAEEMMDDDEQVGFQRTEQLRQLYELLSAAGEPQTRRPSAALSPEDLTDTEWYFLVCMTFEFTNGQGLPGRTMANSTVSWLCNAHFADSKVFSRSLLAKSASIQTVVCFPYLEGVLEFGITEKVLEDQNIIKQIKVFIGDPPPQKLLEIPLESCSGMLDHDTILEYDQNLVTNTHNSPKNSLSHCFQSQEQSWQFVDDDEEEEISAYQNNSTSSSDCISQNLVNGPTDLWTEDDSRYQSVLSKIFKNNQRSIFGPHFRNCDFKGSAFVSWKNYSGTDWKPSSSQMLLKKALYQVPKMHEDEDDAKILNHRFSVLSSLVPSRGKVDKVSLLDDTIDYLKTLERRVKVLESNDHIEDRKNKKSDDVQERTCDNYANKRKASCDLEELQDECSSDCITVSAIEKDVTIEIRCRWRENMMVQVFYAMSSLNLESYSVHSSAVDGILTLTIESKLKSCTASTAKMIRQALQRVINRTSSSF
ncbi:hypothetical protein L2E82_40619 [Cichorium intybus]|uniref:Uncharacterized protein n=1 Tax=Cichorium intybus TaxID=13427 RepID=A0ACB9ALL9_CICIN|nr:hypothetical protein L2E82_40619 [Cichorium intybus]